MINNDININVSELIKLSNKFIHYQVRYKAAIRKVRTYLQILNDEFNISHKRNPIHHMQSRIKSPLSILEKLQRKGFEINIESAINNLTDIAGVRIVCSYLDDVYKIAALLKKDPTFDVKIERDYIKTPKPNGYRSLHYIINVPVVIEEQQLFVPVELQIRTIAMDFWASLEHRIRYKNSNKNVPKKLETELVKAADDIAKLDKKMQELYDQTVKLYPESNEYDAQYDLIQPLIEKDEDNELFFPINK